MKYLISLILVAPLVTYASSYTYKMNGENKSEKITYRACGCADSCWKAQLKSNKKIIQLRCDCENLFLSKNKKEIPIGSCQNINESDQKFELIRQKLIEAKK